MEEGETERNWERLSSRVSHDGFFYTFWQTAGAVEHQTSKFIRSEMFLWQAAFSLKPLAVDNLVFRFSYSSYFLLDMFSKRLPTAVSVFNELFMKWVWILQVRPKENFNQDHVFSSFCVFVTNEDSFWNYSNIK